MGLATRAAPLRRLRAAAASARLEPVLLTVTAAALAAGGAAWLAGADGLADLLWGLGTVSAVVPAVVWVLAALRRGHAGVDLIAVLALGGTLAVGEYLAGSLIALMLATGRTLEAAAQRRASHDLRALLEHAPRSARRRIDSEVRTVPLAEVAVGDLLVVGPGEVVPVDGLVESTAAVLDESVLTGEPLQVERPRGEAVRSGVVNAGGAFDLRATATEQDSTYAGIVRLARQAGAESAPVVRLADRYAAWFLPLSLAVAGLAWLISGSAVRAVAVLVVATPCPLLLAAPVAIVSGLSRASRVGVVIRDGGALENLGRARTLLLDKTGTLTGGRPRVLDVTAAPDWTARRSCAWLPRSISTRRTCWPRPSSTQPGNAGWPCRFPRTSPRNPAGEPWARWTGTGSPSAASTPRAHSRPGSGPSAIAHSSTTRPSPGSASTVGRSAPSCCATRCAPTLHEPCATCERRASIGC